MLSPETHRCLGVYTSELGNTRCERRETCARYVQRHAEGARAVAQWLCPTPEDFYGAFIPQPEAVE